MKTSRLLIIIPACIVMLVIVYIFAPIEITRRCDIKFGNQLVEKLEKYREEHNNLPEEEDWDTFSEMGFKMAEAGTKPVYRKLSAVEFELVYPEGFDGPYLFYNSEQKKWKTGCPAQVE